MNYFPMFVDLTGKKILVAGGGTVALRKVRVLKTFGPQIVVAAKSFCPALLQEEDITLLQSSAEDIPLSDFAAVIAATDDAEVNHAIAKACIDLRIPVNTVDDAAFCSFLFPALVTSGPLTVGISSSGISPACTMYLKEKIRDLLPDDLPAILNWLAALRPGIKALIADEKKRSLLFHSLFEEAMRLQRPLTEEETAALMQSTGGSL
ncbi:MAG: bifunctional precorrin-2 dehydrogenase/sirohydrochlorin ferrochelatase [Firmicutes bacterium]|nr:bifunctional precorrin-2 dehydrogenase/sirohydrochlorin ferrochelatase [Bacillota bacterium]